MLKPAALLARTARSALLALFFAVLGAGCLDTPKAYTADDAAAAAGVAVKVEPTTTTVPIGDQQVFAATVTGTADPAVTWQVQEAGCGSVTAGGVYTAPTTAATCHVVAVSRADPSQSAASQITVQAAPLQVAIAVSPSAVTVASSSQTTLLATVSGTANTSVTWQVQEPGCGTVSAAGVYTAPSAAATCHVLATSLADPGQTAASTVTVTPPKPLVEVSVTPGSSSAFACQTVNLSATVTGTSNTGVTWSVAEAGGGTVSAAGVYTAPSTEGTYHVLATSAADPTARASATITVTTKVLSVAVSPANVTIPAGGSVQFTATVTTTCGTSTALALLRAPSAGPVN